MTKQISYTLAAALTATAITACGAGTGTEDTTDNAATAATESDLAAADASTDDAADTADADSTADDTAESEADIASANTHAIDILGKFHYDFRYLDEYENGIGGGYVTYSCSEEGYSTLNDGLQQLSETITQDATAEVDELETLARSMAEDGHTDLLDNIAYSQTPYLVRADSSMVSILVATAIDQAGAHPSYVLTAYNIDPSSGMQFELDELIQDDAYEGLAERLATALVAKYDPSDFNAYMDLQMAAGENADLKEEAIIAAIAEDIQPMIDEGTLTYTVGQTEITFYWEPYSLAIYAAGTLQVPITYADAPDLVWEGYTHAPSRYISTLRKTDPATILDADGKAHSLTLTVGTGNTEEKVLDVTITLDGNDYTEQIPGTQYAAYLIHVDSRNYLYIETQGTDENAYLYVYDLNGSAPSYVDTFDGWFTNYTPSDPDRMALLTNEAVNAAGETDDDDLSKLAQIYSVGADGMPVPADAQ